MPGGCSGGNLRGAGDPFRRTAGKKYSLAFGLNEIKLDSILKDYELILIPRWVLTEIEDHEGRAKYVQKLTDDGYPIFAIAEETYSELTGYKDREYILIKLEHYYIRNTEVWYD